MSKDVFDSLAFLFLPPVGGLAVEAGPRWRVPDLRSAPDSVAWGRAPWLAGASARDLLTSSVSRETALRRLRARPPKGYAVRGMHRWPPPEWRAARLWSRSRAAVMGGALVELCREPQPRVIDACADAAGAEAAIREIRPVSGGSAMARTSIEGRPAILKVARVGGPGDPYRAGEALERLRSAGIPLVPEPFGRGKVAGAGWAAESTLPGRRPKDVPARLAAEVVRFCAALPRTGQSPTAPAEQFATIRAAFPGWETRLEAIHDAVQPVVADLPAIMAHGDLWSGNVLVEGAQILGVIDWDAWHASGVPGTDLLHFFATQRSLRQRMQLGEVWATEPWGDPAFSRWTDPYWRSLDIHPSAALLEAVGVAWWAARVAYQLHVRPDLVGNDRWVSGTVRPVVDRR